MTFCTKEIEILDGIEKTLLQIALQPKERDVTRSLWLKDINKEPTSDNITTYWFTRVSIGIISSPGVSTTHHFSLQEEAKNASKDIYIDNMVTGSNHSQNTNHLYNEIGANLETCQLTLEIRKSIAKNSWMEFPSQIVWKKLW